MTWDNIKSIINLQYDIQISSAFGELKWMSDKCPFSTGNGVRSIV